MDFNDLLSDVFYASLKAVDPYETVKHHSEAIYSAYRKYNCTKMFVISFGKAACPMAKAVEESCGDIINAGITITKYKHCQSRRPGIFKIFEAGHPVPDESGENATKEVLDLMRHANEQTLVVCLISGGGSALLVSPYEGITLKEKKRATGLLLESGADIFELNTVRKHISNVKGGRLAGHAYPARTVSLILSDVIGDKLDVIASGPTSPDGSFFKDAYRVLEKYNITGTVPDSVKDVIQKGLNNLIPETPKEGDRIFERVENIIIGSNKIALSAARQKARQLGFSAEITSFEVTGEAKEVAKKLSYEAMYVQQNKKSNKPLCFISGGETTVTVKGKGIGGRNMELALTFAIEIEGRQGISLLSAGTDGTDGPTDAAGAIVDGQTVIKAKRLGIDPLEYLKNNDSYNFFKKAGGLFITGPTGTNVMDIQIVLIE